MSVSHKILTTLLNEKCYKTLGGARQTMTTCEVLSRFISDNPVELPSETIKA